MHSTQRSESQHHAIKRRVKSSTLMLECCKQLVAYNESVDRRAAVDDAKRIMDATSKHIQTNLQCVTNLEQEISLHAIDLIKSQQAQILGYHVERIMGTSWQHSPENLEGFRQGQQTMSRTQVEVEPNTPSAFANTASKATASAASSSSQFGQDAVGAATTSIYFVYRSQHEHQLQIDEHACNDYHLQDQSTTKRITSTTSCTCQFNTCWGLPCRHMLALYHYLCLPRVPHGVVAIRWKKKSSEDTSSARMTLLRQLPKDTHQDGTPTSVMSDRDRFAFLICESRAVCEHAAKSDIASDILLKYLDKARVEIATVISTKRPISQAIVVNNPPHNVPSGRPQSTRIESSGKSYGKH